MAYRRRKMRRMKYGRKKSLPKKYKSVKKKFANFAGKVTFMKVKRMKGRRAAKKAAKTISRKVYRRN